MEVSRRLGEKEHGQRSPVEFSKPSSLGKAGLLLTVLPRFNLRLSPLQLGSNFSDIKPLNLAGPEENGRRDESLFSWHYDILANRSSAPTNDSKARWEGRTDRLQRSSLGLWRGYDPSGWLLLYSGVRLDQPVHTSVILNPLMRAGVAFRHSLQRILNKKLSGLMRPPGRILTR